MSRLRVHLLLPALLGALLVPTASDATAARGSVVKHVRVDGIRIGYRIVGHGRPLVLIPGFGFTMAEWDPKLVAALSRRHRVVLFDNRGVATSTNSRGNVISIEEMAGDTWGLIGALHLGRTDVLGWSMGGYIAQELALEHSSVVRRLVLASTDFGGSKAIRPSRKVIRILDHGTPTQLLDLLFPRTARAALHAWKQRIGIQYARLHLPKSSFNVSRPTLGQQGRAARFWEHRGHGSYGQLPGVRIPTLVAAGSQDVIVPPRNATMLLNRIQGSALLLYAGAGHAFLFQNPSAVAAQLNGFLG